MKNIILYLLLTSTLLAYGQGEFIYNETGLVPQYAILKIDDKSSGNLYIKTLDWIKSTYKNFDDIIDNKIENDFIKLTIIKENALKVGKQYHHIKYTVKISFEEGHYKFEPLKIQSKLNSKYDMGWVDFDLKNGVSFFKKGKIIKKYKSYVKDIPTLLNETNASLYNYLDSK